MVICRFFYALLLLAVPLHAEHVRVASYNLQNYALMDRLVEGKYRPNYPKPEEEKAAVRKAIVSVQPDILVLQEIGDAGQLLELQRDLRLAGLSLPYSAIAANAPDKQRHTAILSRIAPANLVVHSEVAFTQNKTPYACKRGLLEMEFGNSDNQWSLFVVHLKSRISEDKHDPFSRKRRTGEAQALRNLICKQTQPEDRYLICGDFNDTPDSRALKRFLQKGGRCISTAVPCLDATGLSWTHLNRSSETLARFDYFLASPELLAYIDGGKGHIEPLTTGSDHRLIYIDIEL